MVRRRTFLCNHQCVDMESSCEGGEEETQEAVGHHQTFQCHLQRERRTFVSTAAKGSYLPTVINADVSLVTHAFWSFKTSNTSSNWTGYWEERVT